MMPGKRKALDKTTPVNRLVEQLEKLKASIRAKVEHPFRVIKCQFGYRKTRYKGLTKNIAQLLTPVCFEQFVDGEETNFAGDY